jgi:2-polyprenyl-3-methyl-5-hydroxy-6-metoxy-1,4-benzoquinol methylase
MKIHTTDNNAMDQIISQLIQLQQKPAPFTPGEALFWDDPHISSQMLEVHLNPDIDAASRQPETIDRSVKWLIEILGLKIGDSILDLGCGPGLYASRFARAGLQVTGVDYSRRSIEYAIKYANENKLNICYRYQNYLELNDENQYQGAFLIYGDFCPLSPEQRSRLLRNVHRALKPGGNFVLDVSTREHRKKYGVKNGWHAAERGFWKPGPHLVLEQGFDYPEQSIWLDQYTVVETDRKISVYRNWFQDYTPESITAELSQAGFSVESLWGDLTGIPYTPESEWIGLLTVRK